MRVQRIHMLPNPCRFSINGVSFAVTSVDVIVHLKKEEFFKRGEEVDSVPDNSGPDIIAGSCRHLLQQRR
jgi:DNA polymerase alpha subunit B